MAAEARITLFVLSQSPVWSPAMRQLCATLLPHSHGFSSPHSHLRAGGGAARVVGQGRGSHEEGGARRAGTQLRGTHMLKAIGRPVALRAAPILP